MLNPGQAKRHLIRTVFELPIPVPPQFRVKPGRSGVPEANCVHFEVGPLPRVINSGSIALYSIPTYCPWDMDTDLGLLHAALTWPVVAYCTSALSR